MSSGGSIDHDSSDIGFSRPPYDSEQSCVKLGAWRKQVLHSLALDQPAVLQAQAMEPALRVCPVDARKSREILYADRRVSKLRISWLLYGIYRRAEKTSALARIPGTSKLNQLFVETSDGSCDPVGTGSSEWSKSPGLSARRKMRGAGGLAPLLLRETRV